MMTLLCVLMLQAVFDLASLGLGPVAVSSIELDGNPLTVEWLATTPGAKGQRWVFNPATGCKSLIVPDLPGDSILESHTAWAVTLQRVAGVDRLVIYDTNVTDGRLPATIQAIDSPCYPSGGTTTQ